MIPKYQEFMLPILFALSTSGEVQKHDLYEDVVKYMELTQEQCDTLLPSGIQTTVMNRYGWGLTYLKKAKLIEAVKKGVFKITERGLKEMENPPEIITRKYLEKYEDFLEFAPAIPTKKDKKSNSETIEKSITSNLGETQTLESEVDNGKTPEEMLEESYGQLKEELVSELLTKIRSCSPSFFEKLVVDLLLKMGYGGSRADAGRAIGKTNDEGIDGIINEDRLGLDVVYIQAKRWQNTVGRPEIQAFAGSLEGQRAKKGIFITTSGYSSGAKDYVKIIEKKIVLIDGQRLAELMIEFDVGVNEENRYIIKKMDMDYFEAV